jgi:hypothetical protein
MMLHPPERLRFRLHTNQVYEATTSEIGGLANGRTRILLLKLPHDLEHRRLRRSARRERQSGPIADMRVQNVQDVQHIGAERNHDEFKPYREPFHVDGIADPDDGYR